MIQQLRNLPLTSDAGTSRFRATRAASHFALACALGCGAADSSGLDGPQRSDSVSGAPRASSTSNGGIVGLTGGAEADAAGAANACAAISQTAANQRGPADIIFALDNSGSMDEEAGFVQRNMNAFSQQIVAAAVDVHVVVISTYPGDDNGICIDAPLGTGGCPQVDSKLPSFLHVDEKVSSHDALELVIEKFPEYRQVLRPEAQKHVVVVTDDESDLSAERARAGLLALGPSMFDNFIFHGIFAFSEGEDDQCEDLSSGQGKQYERLVAATGGVSGDLCLQDFEPVFDRLAQAVVGSSRLACQWTIPEPKTGGAVDPKRTNVRYRPGGAAGIGIPRAASVADCAAAPEGWAWYYDNEARPTTISVCPSACDTLQKDQQAQIDIEFGCPTVGLSPIR